ncbi:MAG TPA: hypothetical protein VFQ92_02110, partial [Blastocatellia bacterium]|nr:hypothetical protein [Blastocatellia bacterium]
MFSLKQTSFAFLLMFALVPLSAFGQGAASSAITVQLIDSPASAGSGQPNLYAAADGRVYLSWIEALDEKRRAVRFAVRKDGQWSEPRTIIEAEDLLVNSADFPSLVALPGGALVAHWPVKGEPGTHASSIRIARSLDGGKTWSQPVIPHTDRSAVEH